MPSPFPGMDPYVESQVWEDFHSRFINDVSDLIAPRVRPQYTVQIERYMYLVREEEEIDAVVKIIGPDVAVADTGLGWRESTAATATLSLTPVRHRIPMPQRRQQYLVIRTKRRQQVVTVIELLSPTNKRAGPEQAEYLTKRINVLRSSANLVELDLLRGGVRLPTVDPLQPGDYYAFVSRPNVRPDVDVFAWTLRQPLPTIPIPLAETDPDVLLDLQTAFTHTYDRAGYDYSLDYRDPVDPPLPEPDAAWVANLITHAGPENR